MGETKTNGSGGEIVAAETVLPPLKQAGRRPRHDGWTPRRQEEFIESLARTGCVRDACRVVGMSSTSLYRARKASPEFDRRCEAALATARPSLEEAAYQRAVIGWDEPVFQGGKQVGVRRRKSDALLRLLITRGEQAQAAASTNESTRVASIEEVDAVLTKRIAAIARRLKQREQAEKTAWHDDMVARGLAP